MAYKTLNENPNYPIWRAMMGRCYNPNNKSYPIYGKRGIYVTEEWHDFKNFDKWLTKQKPEAGLSLERINNDGPYSRKNCKLATKKEQALNRRSNRLITHKGMTKHITTWAKELGIKRTTLSQRLDAYGWSVDKALTTATKERI